MDREQAEITRTDLSSKTSPNAKLKEDWSRLLLFIPSSVSPGSLHKINGSSKWNDAKVADYPHLLIKMINETHDGDASTTTYVMSDLELLAQAKIGTEYL